MNIINLQVDESQPIERTFWAKDCRKVLIECEIPGETIRQGNQSNTAVEFETWRIATSQAPFDELSHALAILFSATLFLHRICFSGRVTLFLRSSPN
jgi:hypothetical protein